MNETEKITSRLRRAITAEAIRHYRPPWKRRTKQTPVVTSLAKIAKLERDTNPPPEIILDSEGKKIIYKLSRWGQTWKYIVAGTVA